MRPIVYPVLGLLLIGAAPPAPPPPPEIGVKIASPHRTDAVLPGHLLAVDRGRGADGRSGDRHDQRDFHAGHQKATTHFMASTVSGSGSGCVTGTVGSIVQP